MTDIALSVVVPCYNEALGIDEFHRRLSIVMDNIGRPWEVIYVNDGSRDETLEALRQLHARDVRVAYLNLSRNFGKEIALTAGLDHSRGALVVVIDADLQDPPEIIPELYEAHERGFDVVFAQRRERHGDTWLKKNYGGRILQNHAEGRQRAAAAQYRRFSADEPPRG